MAFIDNSIAEVFVSNTTTSRFVNKEVRQGRMRNIASRLYTTNLKDSPENIVRRNIWPIVAGFLPKALIADRTALRPEPARDGSIFLIANSSRTIQLPGLVIHARQGAERLGSDRPFANGLFISSVARAALENMQPSRSRKHVGRTLGREEMEQWLDQLLRRNGEEALGRLRDDARAVAEALHLEPEFQKLNALIGTMLRTRDVRLHSAIGRARYLGAPYDPDRINLFDKLFNFLRLHLPKDRPTSVNTTYLPFYEAYFSNFIEGTEFSLSEAENIIFESKIPLNRPADAHDIIGTYRIVGDDRQMKMRPQNADELINLLKIRHLTIMQKRPETNPGQFKDKINQAGQTIFVHPDLVTGTLRKGFDIYNALNEPFQRAVFMMFMVSEIHPFVDGNGRVARIMMNAELVSENQTRIIIPTIFRNNYLIALKALTHNSLPEPLIKALDYTQLFVSQIDWSTRESALDSLSEKHAFMDSSEAESQGIKLILK